MEIVSTMGSGSLGRELDLDTFVSELESNLGEGVDANFTTKGMVTIRLEENGPAYTVYRTGTFQIRGAEDEEHLSKAESRLQEVLTDIRLEVSEYEFNHVTSVFMESLGHEVNLEALNIALGLENTEYEPEQFPGLIYRPEEFDVTLLVFASGKVIIGGTTEEDEARAAIQHLKEELTVLDEVD